MAVKLPTLKKIPTSSTAPTPGSRIDLKVQNQSNLIQSRTAGVVNLGKTVVNTVEVFEDQKISSVSNEAEQEYTVWNTQELQKLKTHVGDPTDAYANYDAAEKKKFEEIINKRPDLSDRVKRNVSSNLAKVQNSTRVQFLKQRGAQQATYANNLFESTVQLKKNNLSKAASYIIPGDESSFLPYDQEIKDIMTLVSKQGIDNGTVEVLPEDSKTWSHAYPGNDGKMIKVKMDQLSKGKAAKELSAGVTSSVNVLIDTGYIKEAKSLQEKYKGYIDPLNQSKISKKLNSADKTNEAYSEVAEINKLPVNQREAATNSLQAKDPELYKKVLDIQDSTANRLDSKRKRKQDGNYERLTKVMDEMEKSGRLNGIADLENNETYKAVWDTLSTKQRKVVDESFKAPSTTNTDSMIRYQDLSLGNNSEFKIESMTPAQFSEFTEGLSKGDKSKAWTDYRTRNAAKSSPIATDKFRNKASKMLTNKLFAKGMIKDNEFSKLDKRSKVRLAQAQDDLIQYVNTLDSSKSDKELSDDVDAYLQEKTMSDLFGTGNGWESEPRAKTVDTTVKTVSTSTSSLSKSRLPDPTKDMSNKEVVRLQLRYQSTFPTRNGGNFPSVTDQEFLNYVRGNK